MATLKNLPPRPKLDPRLHYALRLPAEDLEKMKKEELQALQKLSGHGQTEREKKRIHSFSPLLHGIYLLKLSEEGTKPSVNESYCSGFIKFLGSRNDLERLGVKVRSQAGNIFTSDIPLRIIPSLEKLKSVLFIELAKPLFPNLDEVIPQTQIDDLHTAVTPITGSGVIVGVIDSGIDFYHPNFRINDGFGLDGQGHTRILRFWDQLLVPNAAESHPAGFTYGVEYTQAVINNELNHAAATNPYHTVRHNAQADADSSGSLCNGTVADCVHGTHVTGIAAGNGRAADDCGTASVYSGAAPSADIIFVRNNSVAGTARLSDSAFIADACSYIFNHATALGRPCVINISQSDDQGPHDGTLLGQEFLDNLINQPGRVLTLSAGNSNDKNSHASGIVAGGATENVTLRYTVGAVFNDDVEIWYDGQDRFDVAVTAPDGTSSGTVVPGSLTTVAMSNGMNLTVDSRLNDPRNNDNIITIIINANSTHPIPTGNWTIALTGTTVINGRFRIWVDRNNRSQSDFIAPHVTTNEMTISDMATTKRAITVGNHQKNNTISGSSACGPTRDGRVKPEIAAIGSQVMSTKSRNMTLASPGNFYITLGGTSMSAPLAAGCAALLFECRGAGLSWFDIKQIFADTADTAGLVIPSNSFGFGRLLMGTSCGAPLTSVDVWLREYIGDLGDEPATNVSWASPDIETLDEMHNPVPNPFYNIIGGIQVDNFIRITVNNRGTQTARNTEVYLYWADPATAIHFPDDWNVSGIFTPIGTPPQWLNAGNKIVIPAIAAGGSESVEFRWLPPVPGSNIRGDDHFCLLARAENEADPSMLTIMDGWNIFRADNNIAIRNVNIQNIDIPGDIDYAFFVMGTPGTDSLIITTDIPEPFYTIELPAIALPFRSLRFVEKLKCAEPCFTGKRSCHSDYWLDRIRIKKPEIVKMLTDIDGAMSFNVNKNIATISVVGKRKLHIEQLRIANRVRMPVKIHLFKKGIHEKGNRMTVTQLSDGNPIGGVVLELRKY